MHISKDGEIFEVLYGYLVSSSNLLTRPVSQSQRLLPGWVDAK